MLKRISDEEISRVIQQGVTKWAIAPKEFIEQIGEVSAQAQLEADKKVMRELFERIRGLSWKRGDYVLLPPHHWQTLKEKYLGDESENKD